ncbi:MAG TPA: hypothetical protein PLC99_23190 [Verrucomicrobiota bacterium]|nr:hypothetical protein [Verrucomicrobiota bacterium]
MTNIVDPALPIAAIRSTFSTYPSYFQTNLTRFGTYSAGSPTAIITAFPIITLWQAGTFPVGITVLTCFAFSTSTATPIVAALFFDTTPHTRNAKPVYTAVVSKTTDAAFFSTAIHAALLYFAFLRATRFILRTPTDNQTNCNRDDDVPQTDHSHG